MSSATVASIPAVTCAVDTSTGSWKVYIHLTNDSDWSVSSYKVVDAINSLDEGIATLNAISHTCVDQGMLFMMRGDVKPVWEDPKNRNGGCFSFKVDTQRRGEGERGSAHDVFRRVCLAVLSRTIGKTPEFMDSIVGVTISPKSSFHILKLWMSNKDARRIDGKLACAREVGLDPRECVFKEHRPEF